MRQQGQGRIPRLTKSQERKLFAKNAVAVPALGQINTPDDLDTFNHFGIFASLSVNQMVVLKSIVSNVLSEDKRTDVQIAEDCGLSKTTVCTFRNDPAFSLALAAAINGVLRGKFDIWVNEIEKIARKTNQWQAFKFLIEVAGLFIPRSQHLNVNVDANTAQNARFTDMWDAFDTILTRMGELGATEADVVERWRSLKAQHAW